MNEKSLLTLKEFIRLHDLGKVGYTRPISFEHFVHLPKDLLTAWEDYVDTKDTLDEVIDSYR